MYCGLHFLFCHFSMRNCISQKILQMNVISRSLITTEDSNGSICTSQIFFLYFYI
jgi:hypothetical protein